MQPRPIELTPEEADFLCDAVRAHRYEDHARAALDCTEQFANLRNMSLDLQDRLKELFGENYVPQKHKPSKRQQAKMSRGRIR